MLQIVRLDRYQPLAARSGARREVERRLRAFRGTVDGVLVSDYGCGLLDAALVRGALAFARERGIPVTVDSRFGLLRFRGMTAVTPNEPEVEEALGVCKRAEVFTLGESLGGVESLIEHPGRMTHASVAGSLLEVPDDLVRLSVGIEDVDDLLADLEQALS